MAINDYYWEAKYKDNSVHRLSEAEPLFLFKDVDQSQVSEFYIKNGSKSFSVDLGTGYLNINGTLIAPTPQELPDPTSPLRLIYIRRTHIPYIGQEVLYPPQIRYLIGWQTTINGVNYRKILKIDTRNDGTEIVYTT